MSVGTLTKCIRPTQMRPVHCPLRGGPAGLQMWLGQRRVVWPQTWIPRLLERSWAPSSPDPARPCTREPVGGAAVRPRLGERLSPRRPPPGRSLPASWTPLLGPLAGSEPPGRIHAACLICWAVGFRPYPLHQKCVEGPLGGRTEPDGAPTVPSRVSHVATGTGLMAFPRVHAQDHWGHLEM